MKKMLIERVQNELCDKFGTSSEFLKRVNRLNDLLRFAIGNLVSNKRRNQNEHLSAGGNSTNFGYSIPICQHQRLRNRHATVTLIR